MGLLKRLLGGREARGDDAPAERAEQHQREKEAREPTEADKLEEEVREARDDVTLRGPPPIP